MIKKLFVWKDDKGTVFRDTAVVSTDLHVSEDSYSSREKANRALFNYWLGPRFAKSSDYFCEKFAAMARDNGWELLEIQIPEEQQ